MSSRSKKRSSKKQNVRSKTKRADSYQTLEARNLLATFIVSTVADTLDANDGLLSLREAIIAANDNDGPDQIEFSIPGAGPHTIQPTTPLPVVTDTVEIDGTTQPGFAGSPVIEIDGSLAGETAGLEFNADGNTVRGLTVNRFTGDSFSGDGSGLAFVDSNNNTIQGNYIGTDVTGMLDFGNQMDGIYLLNSGNNQIGGTSVADRNVIGGNGDASINFFGSNPGSGNVVEGNYIGITSSGDTALTGGIVVRGSGHRIGGNTAAQRNVIGGASNGARVRILGTDNVVSGNYIGVDATGAFAVDPFSPTVGVSIVNSGDNLVGGAGPGEGNVISGSINGVQVTSSLRTEIVGNLIGTDVTGTQPIPNQRGILVGTSGGGPIEDGLVAQNVIAFNSTVGVAVGVNGAGFAERYTISQNSIHSNGGIGIDVNWNFSNNGVTLNDPQDLDTEANGQQNFPVITSASDDGSLVTLSGTLNSTPDSDFTIELFSSTNADRSGFGEGEFFLGSTNVTTNAAGDATFSFQYAGVVEEGDVFSATTTSAEGNTSEFSRAFIVNSSPIAVLDSGVGFTTLENTPFTTANVLDNDSDPDAGDVISLSGIDTSGIPGSLINNGDGTFDFDPGTDFDSLAQGASEFFSFQYTITDLSGATSTNRVFITVTGLDDTAVISGDNTGETDEDASAPVTGSLSIVDADDGQSAFVSQAGTTGQFGVFSVDQNGDWSFVLDNDSVANLNAGDSVTDSFSVSSVDGSAAETVTITINGLDDSTGELEFVGTDGDDIIVGGAGNDNLVGRIGSDVLIGSPGDDVFITDEVNGDNLGNDRDVIDLGNVDGNDTGNDVVRDFDTNNFRGGENNFDTLDFTFQGTDFSLSTGSDINNFVRFIESDGDVNTDAIRDGSDIIFVFGRDSNNPDIITSSIRLEDVIGDDGLTNGRLNRSSIDNLGGAQLDLFAVEGNVEVGSGSSETLNGSDQDDFIVGGRGSDVLVGGAGNDVLTGDDTDGGNNGNDQDTFLLGDVDLLSTGNDVITDFDTNNFNGGENNFDTLSLSLGGNDFALSTGSDFVNFAQLLESDGDSGTGVLIDGDDLVLVFARDADGVITDSVRLEELIGDDGLTNSVLADFDDLGESDGVDIFAR